ncbi:uncharacterized protein HKW66_Vig0042060 [Vigna angularis]|uniref:Dymeclin n=1 Tax=Phaseolus angularis TaxID=3914 RepID=A0A8T0KZZ6_PHAAN|nr:uncharacterized protein HKW66_Vig0042060 [Vigna angularis]
MKAVWSPDAKLVVILTSTFFLHSFKVQFSDKRIHTGGRQPSAFYLAIISLLLTEEVPFAVKDLYVLEFFNSRMDAQRMDGGWSVNEVLQVVIVNCRSWRVDGMKMFTQLHFTYEQESHPEEFFIPYVWKLVLSKCEFEFNATAINLFPADIPTKYLNMLVVAAAYITVSMME